MRTSVSLEPFVLLTRRVVAAPTTVAAIATEAAVSGRAEDALEYFRPLPCDFISMKKIAPP